MEEKVLYAKKNGFKMMILLILGCLASIAMIVFGGILLDMRYSRFISGLGGVGLVLGIIMCIGCFILMGGLKV